MLQEALYIFFVLRAFCAIWHFQISYVCTKIRSLTIAIRRMYFHDHRTFSFFNRIKKVFEYLYNKNLYEYVMCFVQRHLKID